MPESTQNSNHQEAIEKMFEVGAHFGYSRSRRHPSMTPFIFGAKNQVEIIDLEKTITLLEKAKEFMAALGNAGKTALFVAGKPEARSVLRLASEGLEMPYVSGRWIGGTLTNYPEIKKRVERLETLRSQREKGELSKYTKLERLMIDREITRLETDFGGLIYMKERLPDAMVIIDSRREQIAVNEAKRMGIPIIALVNTDCNAFEVDYPIPANDTSVKSIGYFVNQLTDAYKHGLSTKPKKEVSAPEKTTGNTQEKSQGKTTGRSERTERPARTDKPESRR